MIRLLLAFVLLGAMSAPLNAKLYDTYPPAVSASLKDHKTLIVAIGASWCSPCRKMHKEIKANAAAYSNVHLAFVDYDSKWGKKLYNGSSVPALIKYKWDGSKWVRTVRVGYISQSNLKRWINE